MIQVTGFDLKAHLSDGSVPAPNSAKPPGEDLSMTFPWRSGSSGGMTKTQTNSISSSHGTIGAEMHFQHLTTLA